MKSYMQKFLKDYRAYCKLENQLYQKHKGNLNAKMIFDRLPENEYVKIMKMAAEPDISDSEIEKILARMESNIKKKIGRIYQESCQK